MFSFLNTISMVAGMVCFAYFANLRCDPLQAGLLSNSNQILAQFVMEQLAYPGLPGLFIACIFAGSLSTVSSCLNSMSAAIWEDVLKEKYSHLKEETKTHITKIMSVFFGLMCMGVSFLVWAIGGNLIQIIGGFFGGTIGPLLGLYVLGALFPWSNWKGAFAGGLIGASLNYWMLIGQTVGNTQAPTLPSPTDGCFNYTLITSTQPTEILKQDLPSVLSWMYSVSFNLYPVTGCLVTILIGLFISFLTGATDPQTIEIELLFPFVRSWCVQPTSVGLDRKRNLNIAGEYKGIMEDEATHELDGNTSSL